MKEFELLKREVKKRGVACVSCSLGFSDTGRVKNWLVRKKIPKQFEGIVLVKLKTKKEC